MSNAARRRLYLHIGSPKTGTSAIQSSLYTARDLLRSHGVLYPESLIGSADDPKHQPLFGIIRSGDQEGLATSLAMLGSELTDRLHTVVLSSEGFYHHIYEFSEASWLLVKELARLYTLRVIVYVRPQAEYMESLYRQYVKNPRGVNAEYGSSMTIHDLMERPRIRQNLDYYDSLMRWAAVVGDDQIEVRRYSKNVVDDFLSLLNIQLDKNGPRPRRNLSLTREMAELLRSVNASFDDQQRDLLIANMERCLEKHPAPEDRTLLPPEENKALMEHYQESNRRVARKWLDEDELFPGYAVRDNLYQQLRDAPGSFEC